MGAAYRIEVPERWNGDLVVYGHGFRGFGPDLTVSDPPLRRYLIENGFAWAASSYRANGYVPGLAAEDSLALKDLFATLVGPPKRAYFYGTSMGGNAAMIIAEFFPRAFDGILSECGVVAGIELFDFFVASAAAAVYISGVDPSGLRAESADLAAAAAAVGRALTPELGPANDLNEKGRRLAEVMLNLSGGPRPFAAEGLAQFMYVDLAAGAGALLAGVSEESIGATLRAATNEDARYALHAAFGIDAAALNSAVVRKPADLTLRSRDGPYPELAPFTGRIEVPVLQIKTTGDLFVPIHLEQRYLAAAKAAGADSLLVQRAVRAAGHCTFSAEERQQAFDDLVRWVRDGARPRGDDLSGDLSDVGRESTQPLRPGDPGTRAVSP
jgi:hypothetical protein